MEEWLIFIGIIILISSIISFITWLVNNWRKAKKYDKLKPRLDHLDSYKKGLESRALDLQKKQIKWENKVKYDIEAINTLAKEKSHGFPWLAHAYAEYFHLQDLRKPVI